MSLNGTKLNSKKVALLLSTACSSTVPTSYRFLPVAAAQAEANSMSFEIVSVLWEKRPCLQQGPSHSECKAR